MMVFMRLLWNDGESVGGGAGLCDDRKMGKAYPNYYIILYYIILYIIYMLYYVYIYMYIISLYNHQPTGV